MVIILYDSEQANREFRSSPLDRSAAARFISYLMRVRFINNIRVVDATSGERVWS